jgi:hypothetical protein
MGLRGGEQGRVMRSFVLLLTLVALAGATQYTAVAAGGDWAGDSTWGGAGHPTANDTVILNATSGNVVVDEASACMDITCTGYTGTLTLGADLTVYGSLLFVSGMTFTPSTYTVIFAATSAKTITTGGRQFYNVTFNGSGGEWTLQDNFTTNKTITLTAGAVKLNGKTWLCLGGSQTVTPSSGFTVEIGSGNLGGDQSVTWVIGTGVTVTATTGSISGASLTVSGSGTLAFSGAGQMKVRLGNVDISSSNFDAGTSLLEFAINSNQSRTLTSSQPLYNMRICRTDYGYNYKVTLGSDITIENDLTINYRSSYVRTLDLNGYTLTIGGNFTNDDTLTAGTGVVVLNDNTKTSTISGTGTIAFNVLRCQTGGKTVKFQASKTFTVADFDFDGASGNLITLDTDTGSGTFTLSDSSGTNQVTYCHIYRSTATGGATWLAYTSDGNVDGGGNSGWSFSAAVAAGNMLLMFD